jgi:hypothetical protein
VREGWEEATLGYQECSKVRVMEKHVWSKVTAKEENIQIKIHK